jgi:hypothetical protein
LFFCASNRRIASTAFEPGPESNKSELPSEKAMLAAMTSKGVVASQHLNSALLSEFSFVLKATKGTPEIPVVLRFQLIVRLPANAVSGEEHDNNTASKRPGWSMAQDRSSREGDGAVPLRNQKAALRVSLLAWRLSVMAEQYFLNVAQSLGAFHARLALPEHDESLAAHAAFGFRVSICAFAQNLHLAASFVPGASQPMR